VPEGFVYLPPGSFLYGTVATGSLRTGTLSNAPMHTRTRPRGAIMSRTEATYGEWIDFLNSLPAVEADRLRPRVADGTLELWRSTRGWNIRLQIGEQTHVAGEGEEFVMQTSGSDTVRRRWERLPVAGVSWTDAIEFTRWLDRSGRVPGARLCTELEWEFAARGVDGRIYPTGNDLPAAAANTQEKYDWKTTAYAPDEVGSNPQSVSLLGVHDLAGNLWEFTATRNPENETTVARGGAFMLNRAAARADLREIIETSLRDVSLGLRVCADR